MDSWTRAPPTCNYTLHAAQQFELISAYAAVQMHRCRRQRLNCTKAQAHSLISLHAFMNIMLEMLLENQSLNS